MYVNRHLVSPKGIPAPPPPPDTGSGGRGVCQSTARRDQISAATPDYPVMYHSRPGDAARAHRVRIQNHAAVSNPAGSRKVSPCSTVTRKFGRSCDHHGYGASARDQRVWANVGIRMAVCNHSTRLVFVKRSGKTQSKSSQSGSAPRLSSTSCNYFTLIAASWATTCRPTPLGPMIVTLH